MYEALGQYDGKHNGLVGRQELRDRPARLKLVLSDSAMDQALVCKKDMTQLTPQNILGWASIV